MNVKEHNSLAWDQNVANEIKWSVPVGSEEIDKARGGDWKVVLTPVKPVPRSWFPEDLSGVNLLCLASGGGQQAPIFAAAGARVTSFDNSAKQLEQDKFVADRENLKISLEKGDAADLSRFNDESFDFIFHPCSNCFMPSLAFVWREAFRVLRRGGTMVSGFINPILYIFDQKLEENGVLRVKYPLPYSDLESLDKAELNERISRREALEFSHTLEEQIGGQIDAGFVISGFYEDKWSDDVNSALNKYAPMFIATKADKL